MELIIKVYLAYSLIMRVFHLFTMIFVPSEYIGLQKQQLAEKPNLVAGRDIVGNIINIAVIAIILKML